MADRSAFVIPTLVSLDATWSALGACRTSGIDPDSWFPIAPDGIDAKAAKAICHQCPVVADCDADARSRPDTIGIWGGRDERERRLYRRRELKAARP